MRSGVTERFDGILASETLNFANSTIALERFTRRI